VPDVILCQLPPETALRFKLPEAAVIAPFM